jgi:hypothetical protein
MHMSISLVLPYLILQEDEGVWVPESDDEEFSEQQGCMQSQRMYITTTQ